MEEFEDGFDTKQQKEILKSYGKSFLNDTVKYYKKNDLTEKEQEKWNLYNKYFIDSNFTHEEELEEIRGDYKTKYIYLLFLMAEYDKAKEDFDRRNLKIEAMLSDILLMLKEKQAQEMREERVLVANEELALLNRIFEYIDHNKKYLQISDNAIEGIARNIVLEGKKIKARKERLEEINSKFDIIKFDFSEYIQRKDVLQGLDGLIDISVGDYTRGITIEKMLDSFCKSEDLSEKPKKTILKLNSYALNQLRIKQLTEEIKEKQESVGKSIYQIKRILAKYQRIGNKKASANISPIIEEEFEIFKLNARKIKTNSIIEQQFELQPLFTILVEKIEKNIKNSGGC